MKTQQRPTKLQRDEWRAEWDERKVEFVRQTWIRMMRDPSCQEYYAYLVPTDGKTWGELYALTDGQPIPTGAELITAERIPSGTQFQIAAWFERFASRLSVIPSRY